MNSQIIIGSILYNPKCLSIICEHVKPSMLDNKSAQTVLQAMIMMDIGGEPIELVTVAPKVRDSVSPLFLTNCLDQVATAENAGYFAKQQYEYWAKNRLYEMHKNISFDGTLNEILGKISQMSEDFERDFTDKPKQSADAPEITNDYLTYIDGIKTGKTKILKCHTPGLTNPINPEKSIIPFFMGGLYIVINAYTTVGKSAYLTNIAVREANEGANIVIFSNEMGRFGYAQRFAAYFSNVPYGHILENLLNGHQTDYINQGLLRFSQLPIKIYDRIRGVAEIKAILKKLSYGRKVDIVIVDYLQNLVDKRGDRKVQLDSASKALMELSQDMDLTVAAASQIDNASAKGQNANQNFIAVKDSGDVAADADIAIELSRDVLNSDDRARRTIKLAVKKNRPFGRCGVTEVYFNKSFTKITNEYEEN